MRVLIAILAGVVAVSLGGLVFLSCSATAPTDLGARDGRLSPCPGSPNCVCSQADPADTEHHVAPLAFTGDPGAAWAAVRAALASMPRTVVVDEGPGYLRAEATTALFRFTDDLELLLDAPAGVIHVRSASRIGHSDLGANRSRVEALRAAFDARRAR